MSMQRTETYCIRPMSSCLARDSRFSTICESAAVNRVCSLLRIWRAEVLAAVHDGRAITEHYYVLIQNPTKLNTRKLLMEYVFGKVSTVSVPMLLLRPGGVG